VAELTLDQKRAVAMASARARLAEDTASTPATPEDTSEPSVPSRALSWVAEGPGAIVEPILKMGTGLLAKPAGDIAGLAKGSYDGVRRLFGAGQQGPNAEETQQAVQSAIQYEPRTQAGASKWNPLNAVPAGIGAGVGWLGNKAADLVGPENIDPNADFFSWNNAQRMTADGVREAIPQAIGLLGVAKGPGVVDSVGQAAKLGAQSTMVNALKATPTQIASGEAAIAAEELLARGLNPNPAGVSGFVEAGKRLGEQVSKALEGSTATTQVAPIAETLQAVRGRYRYRPNLPQNTAAIDAVGQQLMEHPDVVALGGEIPIQIAQNFKQGFQWGARDAYGKESTAAVEAQKQLGYGFRKAIEAEHPEVAPLNAEQSRIMKALEVIERRSNLDQNGPLIPHLPAIGGSEYMAAAIINKYPWIKANLAHGLNRVGNLLSRSPEATPVLDTPLPFVRENVPAPAPNRPLGIAPEAEGLDISSFLKDFRAQKALDAAQPETLIAREQAANTARQTAAERVAEAASAAERQPASGGMPYALDPTTGRLRAADAGLRGATPDTMMNTGNALASAAEKISKGRSFALTAEERAAWNAVKADIGKAPPELRGESVPAAGPRTRAAIAATLQEAR